MTNSKAEAGPSEPVPAFIDNRSGGPPPSTGEAAGRRDEVAVRRGELAILKGAPAAVVYEMAVRCFLELGRPAVLVDGGCQADPYEVAAIARRLGRGSESGPSPSATRNRGRPEVATAQRTCADWNGPQCPNPEPLIPNPEPRVTVDDVLRNIHVARAFTAHQLEALVVQRLGPMMERIHPVFVGVLSIDTLFRDEQLDRYEARVMQARCMRVLRRLAREHNVMAAATESPARAFGQSRMNW